MTKKRYNTVSIRQIQSARARQRRGAFKRVPTRREDLCLTARAHRMRRIRIVREINITHTHISETTRENTQRINTHARAQSTPRASRVEFKFFKPIVVESRTNFLPILAVIKRNRAAKELILRTKTSSISSSNASTPIRVASPASSSRTPIIIIDVRKFKFKNAPLPESIHPWRFVASGRQFSYHSHTASVRISMHIFHHAYRAHTSRTRISQRTHRTPPAVAPRAAPMPMMRAPHTP